MSNAQDVLFVAVVDASGSMSRLASSVKSGFNELKQEQAELEDGACYLSLVTFSSSVNVPFGTLDAREVPDLGTPENHYLPNGTTALYDGIGVAIEGADKWITNNDFSGQVVVAIWTDGGENSSQHYRRQAVNAMIEERQSLGWNFQFFGVGQGAWAASQDFTPIPTSHVTNMVADANVNRANYKGLSESLTTSRSTGVSFSYSGVTGLEDA